LAVRAFLQVVSSPDNQLNMVA